MSENRSVISSVNVTSTDIKCPGCGNSIGIGFDPVTATLSCPFCGLSTKLSTPQNGAVAEELDFNTALQRASVDWGRYKKLIVCSNCGGQTVYDSEQVTGACPFCGSTSVAPAAENDQIMVPNAVIPFSISKDQVQDLFIGYLKNKKLLKKGVLDCKLENVVGIYLPFWTFDAYTASSYTAYRYIVGKENNEQFTGSWYQGFDDIPIFASDRISNPFISKVQDFDFTRAVPYSSKYLAGIPAERYTLGLNEGWERTKKLITEKIRRGIRSTRCYGEKIYTNYYNVKFRCLMAPVYLAKYNYGKKSYFVAINGQNGKTCCKAPTKIGRIIALILIADALLGVIGYLLFFLLVSYISSL